MKLVNEFVLAAPPTITWGLLTDVRTSASCIPGFELHEIDGDEFRGAMKIKVGAVTGRYEVKARFVERDEAAFRVLLHVEGSETRGQGRVNATMNASLSADSAGTNVVIETDLAVMGKVAQFGRGIIADVGNKLVKDFVACLEQRLPRADEAAEPAKRGGDEAAVEPIDLLHARAPLLRWAILPLSVVIAWLLRRAHRAPKGL